MTKEEVITLMKSSKNENEWDQNCDKVKAAFDSYPEWWYAEIVLSGIMWQVRATWK